MNILHILVSRTISSFLFHTPIVLDKLLRIANQNAIRKREGYRFDNDVKEFATYLRTVCGPFAYETARKIWNYACNNLAEGVLRTKELAEYLNARDLVPFVSLSEDATRITGTIQYDSKTISSLDSYFQSMQTMECQYHTRIKQEVLLKFYNILCQKVLSGISSTW